ncbi:alpha/beta hydrolase [Zunongwangia pacifica]|uniref:Carboxylesterase family protein n=1 Tax=Zunongwangia pacifica TaxID=2911062 RepID=A0A9X1ZRT8_9FLAO|nr:alpha/beta hydrolase [Zunongwangia pacifica]MCL6219882.1 carboxylesterase family protein [Zunongwangia pacifica]
MHINIKRILFSAIVFLSLQVSAQQHFTDSLYKVKTRETLNYAEKDGQSLYLDIYEPENSFKDRPVFIFMHGGGFGYGTPRNEDEVKLAKIAASYGYVAVQISYRLTRKDQSFGCDFDAEGKIETFKLAAEDFLDAVNFMINKKDQFNIDPEKIIIGGSSAGAEAVLSAAFNQDLLFKDAAKYEHIKFQGILSLAGAIVDKRYINKDNTVPTIFFHGTADNLVPYATAPHHFCEKNEPGYLILDGSRSLASKLKELNTSYMLNTFPEAGHEISGIPFKYLKMVFQYFDEVFLNGENQQIENTF